ncbi:uncharacterized protein ACHE_40260A [Aspergillus chevalieri]|uniref:ER membrane protein complex subunit 2 n=1 Tax=Aspergillus chevalieri TaxID=182096 RepID=A0A7R7ZNM1_ASPCH|nr:uncharacterized protein ACHE_40260A [Aspergillus chevalieri]BCR87696.1 hypothetical protein ACHE_40260A [Aspergillus chevalieri]
MSNTKNEPIHSSDLLATLQYSQQAPILLGRQSKSNMAPLSLITSAAGQPEEYAMIERLFFACLQTGDDKSALICLDKLTKFFGRSNERIMGLHGLYEEAIAGDNSALEKCLREYDDILQQNPVNLPVLKRRIALLRSLSRPADAISSLIKLLEATPTDTEAWCELADLYRSQGMSSQAIFCLEEALLITPNAWNVHACLAELLYVCATSPDNGDPSKLLRRSMRHYCRSIELCDDYLRGFYGLALVTSLLLETEESCIMEEVSLKKTLPKLNAFAFQKLEAIVKSRFMDYQGQKCCQSELIAARELLNRFGKSS